MLANSLVLHLLLTPWVGCGQTVNLFSFLKVVMLHMELIGMKHRTPCKQMFCLLQSPSTPVWSKTVKTFFFWRRLCCISHYAIKMFDLMHTTDLLGRKRFRHWNCADKYNLIELSDLMQVGALLNRFKPSRKIFYWPFQGCTSFVHLLCFFCLTRLFICALWSPAGKGLTSWLSFVVSYCEFVTFQLVSWVRCGTWFIRFLIFAPLLTLMGFGYDLSDPGFIFCGKQPLLLTRIQLSIPGTMGPLVMPPQWHGRVIKCYPSRSVCTSHPKTSAL